MADQEHGLESPDQGHRLCVNDCGFSGSPATQNMCPKCYRDLKHSGRLDVEPPRRPSTDRVELAVPSRGRSSTSEDRAHQAAGGPPPASSGRCAACRRRTGLTGFRCRCGTTFCGAHRYPERHGCSFDYKAAGRESIARENPTVKADKLHYKI